mgnify:CR=1 FL=1
MGASDREGALRVAGLRDTMVLETKPGRIEAIVLAPSDSPIRVAGEALGFDPADPPEIRPSYLSTDRDRAVAQPEGLGEGDYQWDIERVRAGNSPTPTS